jgi:hypothetical protein
VARRAATAAACSEKRATRCPISRAPHVTPLCEKSRGDSCQGKIFLVPAFNKTTVSLRCWAASSGIELDMDLRAVPAGFTAC